MRSLNHENDVLTGADVIESATTLQEFWKWAFSDLCDDDIKGIFSEWVVAKLLNISTPRRISWANSDLITKTGVRIEVKSSAYWQSWKHLNEFNQHYDNAKFLVTEKRRIAFGRLLARNVLTVADLNATPLHKSHLYVFAFQHEKELKKWNAMDLSQWEFYIQHASELPRTKSVTLKWLRSRQQPLTAQQFSEVAPRMIEEVERNLSSAPKGQA